MKDEGNFAHVHEYIGTCTTQYREKDGPRRVPHLFADFPASITYVISKESKTLQQVTNPPNPPALSSRACRDVPKFLALVVEVKSETRSSNWYAFIFYPFFIPLTKNLCGSKLPYGPGGLLLSYLFM